MTSNSISRKDNSTMLQFLEVNAIGKYLIIFSIINWCCALFWGLDNTLYVFTFLGFVFTIIGYRYNIYGVFGITILCSLDSFIRVLVMTGGLFRWNSFNYILLVAIALSFPTLLKLRDTSTRNLLLFIGFLVFGLLLTNDFRDGVLHILNIIIVFGLVAYLLGIRHIKKAWYWIGLLCSINGIASGIVYFLQEDSIKYINPNSWAYTQLIGIIAIIIAFLTDKKGIKNKNLLTLMCGINIVIIFLSGSRGSLLNGLFAMLLLLIVAQGFGRSILYIGIFVTIGIWGSTIFFDQFKFTQEKIEKTFSEDEDLEKKTSGRSELVKAGWGFFKNYPILGLGTGSFSNTYQKTGFMYSNYSIKESRAAHMGWLKVLSENGIFGIAFFFMYVWSFAYKGIHLKNTNYTFLGIFISFFMSVAMLSTEFQSKSLWFLAAAGIVLLNYTNQEEE